MFAKPQRVHFIGIGGIGMSGIAEILLALGYTVSGSDLKRSAITDRLAKMGARVMEGHEAAHAVGADVVVTSSAVSNTNPEVLAAKAQKIPVIPRAEMLAELMRLKYGIAIAGMHGKTTTTSMIAMVLAAAGLDPTVVVGGRVDALGSNARVGKSEYLVAEADESDRSFLKLSPILGVVTNLDREHMDCYRDMEDVEAAFLEFMDRVPFYGSMVICADDARLRELAKRAQRRIFSYGTDEEAAFRLRLLEKMTPVAGAGGAEVPRWCFEVTYDKLVLGEFELHVPGRHNVLNATAAVAIGTLLGIPQTKIAAGLKNFRGVDRRFQIKGTERGVTVVDDYGHHPTEILATLRAARECGYKRVHVIFQPHRYTRTRDLMAEFAGAFGDADTVEVLDIYAASEEPIAGVNAPALVAAVVKKSGNRGVEYAASFEDAARAVVEKAADGAVVLTLGAGNISGLAPRVLELLRG
jgi:UDP-N-acetylmuramate--alanine ligase